MAALSKENVNLTVGSRKSFDICPKHVFNSIKLFRK